MSSKSTSSPTAAARVPTNRYVLFLGILLFGAALDLVTKHYAFASYYDPSPSAVPQQHWWIDGWLGIETSTNQGALFGMGQGKSNWFAALSLVALTGIIIWLFVRRAAHDLLLTCALAAISGGIIGNLFDRLGIWHGRDAATWNGHELPDRAMFAVRDWIHFRWENAPLKILDPWPNFNIADSLLVCGAIVLFVYAVFSRPEKHARPKDEPTE